MKKTWVFSTGLVLFLGGAAWGQDELRYQGADANQWTQQLKSADAADRRPAAEALARIADQVQKEFEARSAKAAEVAPAINRALAVKGLRNLTEPIGRIVPALDAAAEKEAKDALKKWQAVAMDAVAFYRKELQDVDFAPVVEAANALGELGPLAMDAIDDLQKKSRDPENRVVKAATAALTAIQKTSAPGTGGPKRLATVQGMVRNLKHQKTSVRVEAAEGLGPLCRGDKAAAKLAVPALIEALGDYDNYVRQKAAESLGQIGSLAKDAAGLLRQAVTTERDMDVIKAEKEALNQIGK